MAGFFAKFWLFWATFEQNLYWLAVVGLANTVIAFFYYLRVLKAVWFEPPAEETPVAIEEGVSFAIWIAVAAVIFLGVLPQLWLDFVGAAVRVLFPA